MALHCVLAGSVLGLTACSSAPSAKSALRDAQTVMREIKTVEYSGTGFNGNFGQAISSGAAWPQREVTSYTRSINYDQKSSSEQIVFAQEVFGGQKQNAEVNGDKAWREGPDGPVPQPGEAEERQLQIWMTPYGFLKAAREAPDTSMDVNTGGITFKALGKYKVTGYLNLLHYVQKVETAETDPVLGDIAIVATYADYRDFNGTMFPTKITQTRGGFPVWNLTISRVLTHSPADLPVPDSVKNAPAPETKVQSTQLSEGVWFLTGGTHHSVLVEFKDYVVLIEAPLNEERTMAVLAEVAKLVPGKPVKYVVNTHHHFDHAGGLRACVAQGITVVTNESNKDYFEKILQKPAAFAPDLLAKNPRPPVIQGVADKYVLTDGKQTAEVYTTEGDTHTDDLLIAYLPGPKIVVEADSYSPPAADAVPPSVPPANAVSLYNNIQRLKLNVAAIVPIHGRGAVSIAEFKKYVGKS